MRLCGSGSSYQPPGRGPAWSLGSDQEKSQSRLAPQSRQRAQSPAHSNMLRLSRLLRPRLAAVAITTGYSWEDNYAQNMVGSRLGQMAREVSNRATFPANSWLPQPKTEDQFLEELRLRETQTKLDEQLEALDLRIQQERTDAADAGHEPKIEQNGDVAGLRLKLRDKMKRVAGYFTWLMKQRGPIELEPITLDGMTIQRFQIPAEQVAPEGTRKAFDKVVVSLDLLEGQNMKKFLASSPAFDAPRGNLLSDY